MPERPAINEHNAYQAIIAVLARRDEQLRSRDDSRRFAVAYQVGMGFSLFGGVLFAAAIVAGLTGWSLNNARSAANFGILTAFFGLVINVSVLLVALLRALRRVTFWNNERELLGSETMVVEELALSSQGDLKTAHQMLVLRRETLLRRQRFVLGPGADISPFIVLFIAIAVPHSDITKLIAQYAPWAAQLPLGPAGWIGLITLVVSFTFARFRTLDVDETYSTQIGLVSSASERAAIHTAISTAATSALAAGTTVATHESAIPQRAVAATETWNIDAP